MSGVVNGTMILACEPVGAFEDECRVKVMGLLLYNRDKVIEGILVVNLVRQLVETVSRLFVMIFHTQDFKENCLI